MPDLAMPIFNQEPVTSLIGNMLFPNDPAEAMAAAAWYLDGKLVNAPIELVRAVDESIIWGVRAAARDYSKEKAEMAAYRGTQIGAVVSYLWSALSTGENVSLEDALTKVIDISSWSNLPGVRSSLNAAKKEFAKVIHFWAILSLEYQNRWTGLFGDPRLFISQSEALLRVMRSHHIAGNTFHSPKYTIPIAAYDWPMDGKIRIGVLPPKLLPESKRRAGRPRKMQSKGNWTGIFRGNFRVQLQPFTCCNEDQMPFVNYRFLEAERVVPNRTTLARSIAQLGFPKPFELAWDLDEVRVWLASRPRRAPKSGAKKVRLTANASLEVEGARDLP